MRGNFAGLATHGLVRGEYGLKKQARIKPQLAINHPGTDFATFQRSDHSTTMGSFISSVDTTAK